MNVFLITFFVQVFDIHKQNIHLLLAALSSLLSGIIIAFAVVAVISVLFVVNSTIWCSNKPCAATNVVLLTQAGMSSNCSSLFFGR